MEIINGITLYLNLTILLESRMLLNTVEVDLSYRKIIKIKCMHFKAVLISIKLSSTPIFIMVLKNVTNSHGNVFIWFTLQIEQLKAIFKKSSKPIVTVPFCCVSRTLNASVNRWICTHNTMKLSTDTFPSLGLHLFDKNVINSGVNRNPICDNAETKY